MSNLYIILIGSTVLYFLSDRAPMSGLIPLNNNTCPHSSAIFGPHSHIAL